MRIKEIFEAYKIAKLILKDLNTVEKMTEVQFQAFANNNNISTKTLLEGSGTKFQSNAYDSCPPLQAVINKKAQAITKGRLISINEKEQPIDSIGFNEAIKIINKPNKYQTKNQFLRTLETFIQVYGTAFVYKVKPIGFNKISGLIIIPNNCLTVSYNKPSNILSNNANLIRYYSITIFGETFMIQNEDVNLIYEIQDSSVNLTNGHEFEAKSRIDALRKPIENIVGSLESRNHLIIKRGADGMISPEKQDATSQALTDVTEIQKSYEKYGLLSNQYHTYLAPIAMKYTKFGMNVRDLGLFDGENADHRTIAEAYGVPIPLLGLPDTTKFNTYKEAKIEFYEETITSDAEIISQAFDVIFDSEKNGYRFYFDYSNLEFMQKSEKDKADGLNSLIDAYMKLYQQGNITRNEYLTAIGQNAIEGGDTYVTEAGDNTPLAVKLGVGGTQSLQLILADPNIDNESKINTLVILFGISLSDATLMVSTK